MKVKINPLELAQELAFQDVVDKTAFRPDKVKALLDITSPEIIDDVENEIMRKGVNDLYYRQYDYYFKMITNVALSDESETKTIIKNQNNEEHDNQGGCSRGSTGTCPIRHTKLPKECKQSGRADTAY